MLYAVRYFTRLQAACVDGLAGGCQARHQPVAQRQGARSRRRPARPGVGQHGDIDVMLMAIRVNVAARKRRVHQGAAHARHGVPQPVHVRVLEFAQLGGVHGVVKVGRVVGAAVRRVAHQGDGGYSGKLHQNR